MAAAVGHRDRHRVPRRRPPRTTRNGSRRTRHEVGTARTAPARRSWSSRTAGSSPAPPFGAVGQTLGEAVFSTGMSGYQETLTDPSYHRQIVVATAPQIGNTGWNHEDAESRGDKIWVAGYAVRDPSPRASNWRATGTLDDELVRQGIVGIAGIDTRAVVRHLRTAGSMKAGVFSGDALAPTDELLDRVRSQPLDARRRPRRRGQHRRHLRRGTRWRRNGSPSPPSTSASRPTPRATSPAAASAATCCRRRRPSTQIADLKPDGVFLSNGPGDPATADHVVGVTREVLGAGIPLFGICFGNQILGRALGRSTYKMMFGHRGINVPVIDHATGRVADHRAEPRLRARGRGGRGVRHPVRPRPWSATPAPTTVSSKASNCVDGRAFSVQYHPEAAAGPHDADYLFDQFVDLMAGENARCHAAPTSTTSWSSAPGRSSSARPASSTTPAPRPAACCAPRACRSAWSTPTRRRS